MGSYKTYIYGVSHALKYWKLQDPDIWEIVVTRIMGNHHALKYVFYYKISVITPRTPCLAHVAWEILPGPLVYVSRLHDS